MLHLTSIATHIQNKFDGDIWIIVRPAATPLAELLAEIPVITRTAQEFEQLARPISREQARMHLVATLHRDMAYMLERMPLQEARALATAFLADFEAEASYFSTCEPLSHDQQHISGSYGSMTNHTFESILYCVGCQAAALIVTIDED